MSIEKEQIVANVYAHGDPSVGMFPWSLTVTIDGMKLESDQREYLRADLTKLFVEHMDYGKVEVTFNDECPDCGKINCDRKCEVGR